MSQIQEGMPRFQCVLCGEKLETIPKNRQCPACGARNIRNVEATSGYYDDIDPKSVKHFKEPVTMCWNEKLQGKKFISHPLKEAQRGVVALANSEYHTETYCETCGAVYGWPSGRAATPAEIADCQAGKIPLRSKGSFGGDTAR